MLFVIVICKLGIKTIPKEIIDITKILKKEAGLLANNFCCFRSHLKHPYEQCQLIFSLKGQKLPVINGSFDNNVEFASSPVWNAKMNGIACLV